MDENIFYDIVENMVRKFGSTVYSQSENQYNIKTIANRGFGELHKFFAQDYADMVSLDESYKDFLFALQPKFFEEIMNNGQDV